MNGSNFVVISGKTRSLSKGGVENNEANPPRNHVSAHSAEDFNHEALARLLGHLCMHQEHIPLFLSLLSDSLQKNQADDMVWKIH